MHYTFKSKATGDLIMMGPIGDEVLRVIGKEPAVQGIIEPATMPGAISAIERAIAGEESQPAPTQSDSAGEGTDLSSEERVSLRQRAWPLVEMMKRAYAENASIVWGV
ncbi:DUF1840 domain-containing protein [Variovorax ureilyticus]|uniref:DUF1840 domain-containing protein n=1 Tax=Variovorax ureilyticus TaxID=1836198 RepID=A0ABU8VL13_9BURK